MAIQFSTEIRCPPRALWPWLTEPERMKKWMKGLISVANESGDPSQSRVGTRSKMVIKEGGRVATYDSTIVEWQPPRRIAITLGAPHWKGLEMYVDYTLHDLGNATRLDYVCDAKTTRMLFKVMCAVFGIFAKLQAKSFIRSLKTQAEAECQGVAARA